jgi:hypothetical protein
MRWDEIGIWLTAEVVLEEGDLEADEISSAGLSQDR